MNLDTFQEQLRSYPNPVIVDLWAPRCGPCWMTKPILEALAREYEGRIDFWALNADEHTQLLRELKVFSIPTVLMTRNGEIVKTYTGSRSREAYRSMFEALTRARPVTVISMSMFERFLRLFAGGVIAATGLMTSTWSLILIGGVIAFLGIYDRCPIWRMITG
ncbi:MAG TPA: thioredoxin domain-containing protein [Anaerolineales bacterium]|nr:thioredoxin domain-containing protein [Anaerolineales bacterium]